MRDGFNPLSDLFIAQFAKPSDLAGVNLRALTPFQRALLVIDGTVTKFIEAYTLEPVAVRIIANEQRSLLVENAWLEAGARTEVFAREVVLEGKYTGALYGHALSLVVPNRLPGVAVDQLESNPGGLGRIFLESRIETRREVLWYGREAPDSLPGSVRSRMSGGCLCRTYRIIAGGRPIALIHERFPIDSDRVPAQT